MRTNKEDRAGVIGCSIILLFIFGSIAWVILAPLVASFPATEDPDCHYTLGCNQVVTACLIAFRTDNILLKQWKGGSLSVYVDRHTFEDIPFPDRDRMLKPIVEGWCKYNGGPLLPSLWFVDMRTGKTLEQYGCLGITLSRMWEKASKSKAAPPGKTETVEEKVKRIEQEMRQKGLLPKGQ